MLTLIILSAVCLDSTFGDGSSIKKEFSVQPGGKKYSSTIERDGIKCTFTYECQGGTNEIRDDNGYGCVVERSDVTPPVEALTASAFVSYPD
ncbi:unnamed protein product [Schistosoma haematobium]|nr:unnamed protein product [Schistosoma haematobium]